MRETFGWSATATSAAFAFQRIQGAFISPVTGLLVDRLGPRRMILIGLSIIAAGLILMSRIQTLWHFYLTALVSALGMSLAFNVPMATLVVRWFKRKRSRALGLLMIGPPIGGLFVPIVGAIYASWGWRDAILASGIATAALGIPLGLFIHDSPERKGLLPDGDAPGSDGEDEAGKGSMGMTVREALRSRAFWILSTVLAIEGMALNGAVVHQVQHLRNEGLSHGEAATVVAVLATSYLFGRIPFTLFGDRVPAQLLAVASVVSAGAGFIFFAYPGHLWAVALAIAFLGLGHGVITPLRSIIAADYFGTKAFASIMGVFEVPFIVGAIFGPLILGAVFDWRGDYTLGMILMGGLIVASAPFLLLLGKPRHAVPGARRTPA
jgi:MFS family permease